MNLSSFRLLATAAAAAACIVSKAAPSDADSLSARFDTYASWCSPEKLYLHIDRNYYTAGETIWFRGWLKNASSRALHPESNYIYAELLDQDNSARLRVKVKRDGSGFPGHIDIPENFETGDYTLRAYTLWQLNRPLDYMFNQKVKVLGAKEAGREKPAPGEGLDLSFWPEGGRYFAGGRSVIGFKAMDDRGRSVDFTGWLAEDGGDAVLPVATRHDGMGVIEFLPKEGKTYHVETESGMTFPLPAPSTEGATINLRHLQGFVYSSVRGFGNMKATLFVRDLDGLSAISQVELDGKMRTFKAEDRMFSPGINHMLLVSEDGRILSERLFFVTGDAASNAGCDFKTFDMRPAARAVINGNLTLEDGEGKPLDGECSISIVRGSLKHWQQDEGLLAYMRLSSELKGHINNPDYYFDPAVSLRERTDNLDLLMMIQGWNYYDMEAVFDPECKPFKLRELKEYTQSIRGRITRRVSSKVPKKFTFSVFIPKLRARTILDVEQGSSFLLDSLEFPENTDFLINVGTSRIGTSYMPQWNGDTFAQPYAYFPAPGSARMAAREEDEKIPLMVDGALLDTLSAAVVVAEPETWDDVLVFGQMSSASDLKLYKDRTLIEYLNIKVPSFVYNGEVMYNRMKRMSSFNSVDTGGDDEEDGSSFGGEEDMQGAVKLLVDEMQQSWWGYDMLRLEEIESISISKEPDPIWGGEGGIVAIKLKTNVSMSTIGRDPSLLYFVPLGYQQPKEFYSPRYDRGDSGDFDKRNTVFWSPSVSIRSGRGLVTFCNTDQMDYPYIVRIEGFTSSGIPFSRHCILDFKE